MHIKIPKKAQPFKPRQKEKNKRRPALQTVTQGKHKRTTPLFLNAQKNEKQTPAQPIRIGENQRLPACIDRLIDLVVGIDLSLGHFQIKPLVVGC